jgi:hypothetical protein
MENWKTIPGYEGLYEVSDLGRVRSFNRVDELGRPRKGRILKPVVRENGRVSVTLCKNRKQKIRFVHALVLTTFVGAGSTGLQCCHNNGNPSDNRVLNLRWGTALDNSNDRGNHQTTAVGERNGNRVLKESEVVIIANGSGVGTEMAHRFGISKATVSQIRTGRTWGWLTGIKYQGGVHAN